MFVFGTRSLDCLGTCEQTLQKLAREALRRSHIDFSITEGHRSLERQKRLFLAGKSKLDGVTRLSQHNHTPSRAFDFVPYPIDWQDTDRFYLVAGGILSTANDLGIKIVWGGDWNMNGEFRDQSFHDLPHIQLA
jgi:peptidoglycan L-alanyl-D-glutamate endopeptidase CwlK